MTVHRVVAILLTLALTGAPSPLGAQSVAEPELYSKSLEAAVEALAHYGELTDDAALERVADIGYRLAAHADHGEVPFTFHLIEMREPNAFALPGGQIFITRGMLDLGLDDDQLANLLGHEIGHVTLEHGLKMQRRATLLNALSQALVVGVLLADDGDDRPPPGVPEARYPRDTTGAERVRGAAAASVILGELLLRSYSRDFEDEADEVGQRLAATAGFDPDGAASMFELMERRLPQSREYGYWRTHPFFTERVDAADARGEQLRAQRPRPADRYRRGTQAALLRFSDDRNLDEDAERLLDAAALSAWPRGDAAERLRLESLHRLRDEELEGPELSRDYGRLIRAYEEERREVAELTPESDFLSELDGEIAELEVRKKKLYPRAVELFSDGVYQTEFLVSFLSNYPESPLRTEVALALAHAYSRLDEQTEAVTQYLEAWRADPDSDTGRRALSGLKRLADSLDGLAALGEIAAATGDDELTRRAEARLTDLADSYDSVENGAAYLDRFPDGAHAATVATRLDRLAQELYGEVILYRGIGDSVRALERIQKILTYAPLSPAAESLREGAVIES